MEVAAGTRMGDPVLDQFSNELFAKAGTVILVCGIAGILLRALLDWLEHKATQFGKARRAARQAQQKTVAAATSVGPIEAAPHCPACNAAMVKRTARRGANVGSEFWGCSGYPRCRGTRAI